MNMLHWKRSPMEEEWHLTFDGYEALCGKTFASAMRNFSKDLAKGPPDQIHEECQVVARVQMGLSEVDG